KILNRFLHTVVGQSEGSEVGADAGLSLYVFMDKDGLFRTHVNRLHKPAWTVGPDRDKCHIYRSVAFSYLSEKSIIARISGKVDVASGELHYISTPKCFITIGYTPSG